MSLIINFKRLNNDGTETINPRNNNILADQFEVEADITQDGLEPQYFNGDEMFEWSFTYASGTNATASRVGDRTGQGPHQIVFYEEAFHTIHLKMTRNSSSTSGYETIYTDSTEIVDGTSVPYVSGIELYDMDYAIHGPNYIKIGSTGVEYYVKDGAQTDSGSEAYVWSDGTYLHSTSLDFLDLNQKSLTCKITHGQQSNTYTINIKTVYGSTVEGKKSTFDVSPNLMFFNNSGDNLNFEYTEYEEDQYRWEGDLIFEQNGSETFKNLALYTLERVEPIALSNDETPVASTSGTDNIYLSNSLQLSRYQLFNEFGVEFLRARDSELDIFNITIAIDESGFYSKWVYGNNFHMKYRIGSEVWFENVNYTTGYSTDFISKIDVTDPISNVTAPQWKTFTVIGSKPDAILVITETANVDWMSNNTSYDIDTKGQVHSANFVRVWNPNFIDPQWNESGFRAPGLTGLYDKKKLTFVNTQNNDGVYTANFRENDTYLPYKDKYLTIDLLNRTNLIPGQGFQVILNFLTNRVFVGYGPIDFIPKGINSPFLSQKDLVFFEWSTKQDDTPAILQDNVSFLFEKDGTNTNFDLVYNIIKRDTAANILIANDSDRKGYTVTIENVVNTLNDPSTIEIINLDNKTNIINTFKVILTNNTAFNDYIALLESTGETTLTKSDLANIVQLEINSQAKGVATTWSPGLEYVIINESAGWLLRDINIKSVQTRNGISSLKNDPTDGQLPTYGIIGSQEYKLNENTDGYVYRRTRTNTFHIQVDFDINADVPIWYTLNENQTALWVDIQEGNSLVYQQNMQQSSYLVDSQVVFNQQWTNEELLTSINIIDLDDLAINNPDAQIFDNIATEQLNMFQDFIANWQQSFDYYGIDLYTQTDANKWDFDIIYDLGDYTKYKGVFYQSLTDNNTENEPDTSIVDWKELDELVLLGCARKYTVNSLNGSIPSETDDYMKIDFNSVDTNKTIDDIEYVTPLVQTRDVFTAYQFEVLEDLTDEYDRTFGTYNRPQNVSERIIRHVIIDDIDQVYGLNVKINGIDYKVPYDNIPTDLPSEADVAFDIQETLFDWGNTKFGVDQDTFSPDDDTDIGLKYYQQLETLGIVVYLERSGEKEGWFGTNADDPYDTLVFLSKYPNINFTFELIGTNNGHRIRHSDIEFYEIGNILTITINGFAYSASGATPSETVNTWVQLWSLELIGLDIIAQVNESDNNNSVIELFTLKDGTKLEYTIWVGINPSPVRPLYNIYDWRPGNEGIILAGNEILNFIPNSDFQQALFATAMIVSVEGSKWALNNQEYNILLVDPLNIGLSYQGPFWNSYDQFGDSRDDIDTDPDEPGQQGFDWDIYADPTVTFDVLKYLKINRITNAGNDITTYQVTFEDTSTIELSTIYQWEWNFGDEGVNVVIVNDGTELDSLRVATNIYNDTGNYTVTLKITYTNDTSNTTSIVYALSDEDIVARGPRTVDDIALRTREFLRYPREGYDEDMQISLRWRLVDIDDIEEEESDIFLYDFSGTQLTTEGVLAYTGPKPLFANGDDVYLNEDVNNKIEFVSIPKSQQTIFSELDFELERIDSETDISFQPEPMQTFIAYNSATEDVDQKILILERIEPITVTIETSKNEPNNTNKNLPITAYNDVVYFISELNEIRVDRITTPFTETGIKVGQVLKLSGFDNSHETGQAMFLNSGKIVTVENYGINWIRLTSESSIVDEISWKQSQESYAPYHLVSASMTISFEVQPIEIGRFNILGQTEIEDDRFRVLMYNMGINIQQQHTYIFKDYDVKEKGIDWTFLNRKRKEMLSVFPQIYNYIGSYKSMINAINYFGYNELILNEYYRNVDKNSPRYGKLEKIEIPDIFNNQVEGFEVNDFIIGNMPNERYWKTNLFNLTYQITDTDGNNVIGFSLDEVVTKLLGLKKWLNEETVPIGRRILDITGRSENSHAFGYLHDQKNVFNIKMDETISPVEFKTEAYLQPIVSESSTYNVHIEFSTVDNSVPDYFSMLIMTFATEDSMLSDNFNLKAVQIIREFRTTLDAYNFAANLNVDPFILIETTTDNGYGIAYKKRETYSLQSIVSIN